MTESRPALTFDAIEPERTPVELFGTRYEMVAVADLSLRQRARLHRLTERVQSVLEGGGDCTDEEAQSAEEALVETIGMIVPDAGATVLERLHTGQRLVMLNLFTGASAMDLVEVLQTLSPPNQPTGDRSLPDSSSASDIPEAADG